MLRELKTFVAVTQYGTFAAAGQRIGLTQSAVSAQMRILENALGIRLFDRSGRSVMLSAAGNRVLPMAEEILSIFARMSQPNNVSEYRGVVKIGAISTIQSGLLPEVLVGIQQLAPHLETRLVPGVSFNLLSMVETGDVDLAITIKPSFSLAKELWSETLLREPYVLIVPQDVTGDDARALLREQPFVRYDRTSFGGRLVSQFLREQRIEPRQILELDEIEAIVRMVENRLGIALVPLSGQWLKRHAKVRVIPLQAATFYRELIIVMRHANRRSSLHMMLTRCLSEGARALESDHQAPSPD
ncbi:MULTISPECIES: LysR family transcriptional regulator [Tatumella]|uniref:LysR family transcriptional regulator n=1 Tax=Tatumella punctata TaxID=399969 RepID=A0ABW1VK17_9GAMM|nr:MULTISPECIES: LysR family transcriptional regulator [unclassified Tatumella]MBS0856195.1 LysR family transcriptional regulator [Tatumella sp. JGM16]MBS0877549.1 LysR family transcriptional regulator [Tatumella sp. JGM82]MBS0891098.1 LysR family transcriptional regulator [Tatumella sp. JGM94]MBS0893978.1 LysR family transcriptional regulator [Tatumella sp. JGM130]MBS0902081.1 LysR family transcriptional regulator [Tatumella sp. JGM100]